MGLLALKLHQHNIEPHAQIHSSWIDTELAGTLRAATSTRTLQPNWIHHTHRDCRYGSDDYVPALEQHGARPSMSLKGDCWDDVVSVSFFATRLSTRSYLRRHRFNVEQGHASKLPTKLTTIAMSSDFMPTAITYHA